MAEISLFDRIGEETLRHMRGRYNLDEVGDGKDELKFRKSGKTVLTVYIRDGFYDFLVIFGRQEREKFEATRNTFSEWVQKIYDESKTYHDGKWMMFPIRDLEALEEMKKLIGIKKRPNRKPFPKEGMLLSRCGSRCDLCLIYAENVKKGDRRAEFAERSARIYGDTADYSDTLCPGCHNKADDDDCAIIRCLGGKGYDRCIQCQDHPCENALIPHVKLEAKSLSADDITTMVLPYVQNQYGN